MKDRQMTKIAQEFPEWLGSLGDHRVEGLSFILKPQFGGGILALRNLDDPSKYNSSEFACVAKGTPVLMKDGCYKPVESVAVGDAVLTLRGARVVTNTWGPRFEDCVRADVWDNKNKYVGLQVQPKTHRILTPGGWQSYSTLISSPKQSDVSCISPLPPDLRPRVVSQTHETPREGWKPLPVPVQSSPDHQDCRESSSSSVNAQSYSAMSCDGHQEDQLLASLSCRVALHEPDSHLACSSTTSHLLSYEGEHEKCSCEVRDFSESCSGGRGLCDGQLHRMSVGGRFYPPSRDGVAEHIHEMSERDGFETPPSHNHRTTFEYDHPYTGVRGWAFEGVQFGTCVMIPCGVKEVYDLTVEDENHYISSSKLCNSNSIAVDELTMNEEHVFQALRGIMRWPGLSETKFIAGTNPIGIGMAWVKRYWITRDFPANEKEANAFFFVPAKASDNPYKSESYELQLAGLSENLRRAYLDGSWDTFEGQVFTEFDESLHVCDAFPIPAHWRRYRAIDHGRTSPTSCHWYAVDERSNLWVYREYYQSATDADVNARNIVELSLEDLQDSRYWFTVLDGACWSKHGGETIAEIYERNGVYAEPSAKDRLAGLALVHEYLRHRTPLTVFRGERRLTEGAPLPEGCTAVSGFVEHPPRLHIFRGCTNLIREMKDAVIGTLRDGTPTEDVDDRCSQHSIDEMRYGLQHMHEGSSRKKETFLEKLLRQRKNESLVSPATLSRFYANKLR